MYHDLTILECLQIIIMIIKYNNISSEYKILTVYFVSINKIYEQFINECELLVLSDVVDI